MIEVDTMNTSQGLGLLIALTSGLYACKNEEMSDGGNGSTVTNQYLKTKKMIPTGTNLCEEQQAYNLCEDVKFTLGYNSGSIGGIDDILFETTTEDFCGYLGTKHGGIIGMQHKWVVKGIVGEPNAVASLWEKIGNDKVLNEVYLLAPDNSAGSILLGYPNTADRIKVHLNETYDGSSGVDYLFGNGMLWTKVEAYGEVRSVSLGREHIIPIVNPTLMPLIVPSTTTEDIIVEETCEFINDLDPLCADPVPPHDYPDAGIDAEGPILPR